MAKVQLTIKTSYLPNWHVWEGVRELVQNGRDAEVEQGAPLSIDLYNNTLRIENTGTTLPMKALLLGHTTKVGNSNLIGKFGEGLKLGVLALLRDGYKVKIRNGSEVWEPTLEVSDVFDGEQILAFHIAGGRKYENRVRVEIQCITPEVWGQYKSKFLFLNPPSKSDVVNTSYGTLLLDKKYANKVFVKGIYVQDVPDYSFGYDLNDVELDRDRKMVESWNLQYSTRNIILSALNVRGDLFSTFFDMVESNSSELKNLDSGNLYYLSDEVKERTVVEFKSKYGSEAIAVDNLEQSKQVEHYGKRGIIVSKSLGAVLSTTLGSISTQLKSLSEETVKVYNWHELSSEEQANLESVVREVSEVEVVSLETIKIVDFRSSNLLGQYSQGITSLSKKLLVSYEDTLATLLHEIAHSEGGDGEHSHINRLEKLWTKVYANLRRKCLNQSESV